MEKQRLEVAEIPYSVNPTWQALLPGLQSLTPTGSDDADAVYRNFTKGFLNKGKDVSQIAAFQPTLQAGATRGAMAAESAGYGDAGIRASQGSPDQQAVQQRQAQIQQERIKEGTGQAVANQINPLMSAASAYGAQRAGDINAFNLGQSQDELEGLAQNSAYYANPWMGALQGVLGGAASGAAAAFL